MIDNFLSTLYSRILQSYEQKLMITANKLFILDKDKFAEEMIERCIDNDFHEMKFSYDLLGSPDKIEITVYLNERDRKCAHQFFVIKYDSICSLRTEIKYRITRLMKYGTGSFK